jgi:hypothetical protein
MADQPGNPEDPIMYTTPRLPGHRRWTVLGAAAMVTLLCSQLGCVANKYKLSKKDTPPVQALAIAFPPSPPQQASLVALVSYRGPGSWKREALWDEYVIALENRGERPLTVASATLADAAAAPYATGSNPWALEKQSKALEKRYRKRGESFMRTAGAGVLGIGAGAAVGAAIGGASYYGITPAIAGASLAVVVVLPVYYLSVAGINHHHKKAVVAEFNRRRLPLPLTLAPGETRTASLFYPMVRSPSSLTLSWSNDAGTTTTTLPLEFLRLLHVPPAPTDRSEK